MTQGSASDRESELEARAVVRLGASWRFWSWVERQHGRVGGLPDQDWSLRVTLVFRREGSEWQLAHRHADPLLKGISLEQASAIARG